jgi:hypothetical protein
MNLNYEDKLKVVETSESMKTFKTTAADDISSVTSSVASNEYSTMLSKSLPRCSRYALS